jgi:hypothetical protein
MAVGIQIIECLPMISAKGNKVRIVIQMPACRGGKTNLKFIFDITLQVKAR